MTRYEYVCDVCGLAHTFRFEAGAAPDAIAHSCGGSFRRRYSTRINWAGFNKIHPRIQNIIDDAPRRRDEYEAMHHD
jgi:hypothetical protein